MVAAPCCPVHMTELCSPPNGSAKFFPHCRTNRFQNRQRRMPRAAGAGRISTHGATPPAPARHRKNAGSRRLIYADAAATCMRMLGTIDLEVLQLAAAAAGGRIDESAIEHSALSRLGVGRILDALASLRDRDLLRLDEDGGSFVMTDAARAILWSDSIPLWARILRLLEIRSCGVADMAAILRIGRHGPLEEALGGLQREGFVMAAPQIRGGGPQKVYEILPEGIERMEAISREGGGAYASRVPKGPGTYDLINEIERIVSASRTMSADERRAVLQKVSGLRDMIGAAHAESATGAAPDEP